MQLRSLCLPPTTCLCIMFQTANECEFDSGRIGYFQVIEALVSFSKVFPDLMRISLCHRSFYRCFFQISKWGNVVWYHDLELMNMRMQTAACALFMQLSADHDSYSSAKLRESLR